MSYQVLARKWRPQRFSELVGQQQVLRALHSALSLQRLHHAYLFTGTRGVGKTTLARLFAKALNCEQGISPEPCGQCTSCQQIQQGNFIDLIEIDAASRTRVEDTRELLDNVPYRPTQGRYKVYLIDEVHMLSGHSFNALLKTLEEPPEHVKFLLATTDPQKLPVTVLSRCLQFHLSSMSLEQIQQHLATILHAEQIPFEPEALRLLAHAGQGSMRDALSLTEQAIAFGRERLQAEAVASMLGLAGNDQLYALLDAVIAAEVSLVMPLCAAIAERGADFNRVLADLLSLLHGLSVTQLLGEVASSDWDPDWLKRTAQRVPAEAIQLYYQIALHGRRDLPFAPDGRCGFEMTLLRMLAFRPQQASTEPLVLDARSENSPGRSQVRVASAAPTAPIKPAAIEAEPRPSRIPASVSGEAISVPPNTEAPQTSKPVAVGSEPSPPTPVLPLSASVTTGSASVTTGPAPVSVAADPVPRTADTLDWAGLVLDLKLPPLVRKLADHCRLLGYRPGRLQLALDPQQQALSSSERQAKLQQALAAVLGEPLKLEISVQAATGEMPSERAETRLNQKKASTRQEFADDPAFNALQQEFVGQIDESSLKLNS